jgi:hypothetical protein
MARLEEHLPLSEEITWRWPEPKLRASRIFTAIMLLVGVAGALWLWQTDAFDKDSMYRLVEAFLTGILPVMTIGMLDRGGISGLAFTPYWLAVARGRVFSKVEAFEKREFLRATVRESGGRLILHRPPGQPSLNVAGVDRIDEMVEALGLPTLVWRQRRATGLARGILIFAMFLAFALWHAALIAFVVTLSLDKLPAMPSEKWLRIALFICGLPVMLGLPAVLALLASGLAAILLARIGRREVLESVVRAAGDPAWEGKRRKPGAIFRTLNLMVRLTGAAPVMPDRAVPEIRNGPLPKFHTGKGRRRWPSRR